MHIAVVIPTYNEAENLPKLLSSLFALPLDLSVLVVDDNSPDGTGHLADEFASANAGRVVVLHRPGKLGISSAYVQGSIMYWNKVQMQLPKWMLISLTIQRH